jgi:hypothetical protein
MHQSYIFDKMELKLVILALRWAEIIESRHKNNNMWRMYFATNDVNKLLWVLDKMRKRITRNIIDNDLIQKTKHQCLLIGL